MEPLFLPDVEARVGPGAWGETIARMRAEGREYPQIWHLFGFLPEATVHLARFTQAVMRDPAPLSPGLRELIAAHTSARNACPF